jgi:hypothetical protein
MKSTMKNFAKISAIILFMVTPILSFSQDGSGFETFIKTTFEKDLNAISEGHDASKFLNSFADNLAWVNINVSIDGRVAGKKNDKARLSQLMNMLSTHPDLDVKWEIIKINEVSVRENTRLASFEVMVSMEANGKLISKGKNMMEVLARKDNGKFYINYFSIIQVSDKMYKGRCFVDSKKTKPTMYSTITSFPDGNFYTSVKNELFFVGEDKLRVVKLDHDGDLYYWNTVQGIVSKDKEGKQYIGEAKTEEDVVLRVLRDNNSNKCTNMIYESKK